MEVVVGDRKYTIKELKYKDLTEFSDNPDKKELAKKIMILATDMTEEEYDSLSVKDGLKIMSAVNELNGLTENFTQTNALKTS